MKVKIFRSCKGFIGRGSFSLLSCNFPVGATFFSLEKKQIIPFGNFLFERESSGLRPLGPGQTALDP